MTRTKISIVLVGLAAASPAYAHFRMDDPVNWVATDMDGNPQKVPPCGGGGTPDSGPVREYKAGDTISISLQETTFHPGHYRVSLAANQAALPADPDNDVVPDRNSDCGSLAINPSPTLPLIADGLLVHTQRFAGPQTMQVKLPAGMTCDHCVLQVVEFMANHGASCFYHHCANVKITTTGPVGGTPDAGPVGPDAGPVLPDAGPVGGGGSDAGVGGDAGTGGGGGGGCSAAGKDATGLALLTLAAGLVLARRRRR